MLGEHELLVLSATCHFALVVPPIERAFVREQHAEDALALPRDWCFPWGGVGARRRLEGSRLWVGARRRAVLSKPTFSGLATVRVPLLGLGLTARVRWQAPFLRDTNLRTLWSFFFGGHKHPYRAGPVFLDS